MPYYRIFQACQHQPVFQAADLWIKENYKEDQAQWHWSAGFSHINGVMYPASVYFKHPGDYLAFKLRFGEICT